MVGTGYLPLLAARLPCPMSFFVVWPHLRPVFAWKPGPRRCLVVSPPFLPMGL